MGSRLLSKRKYKKRRKQRPVIKITSDHMALASVVLDAGILFLLVIWLALEVAGVLPLVN